MFAKTPPCTTPNFLVGPKACLYKHRHYFKLTNVTDHCFANKLYFASACLGRKHNIKIFA